MKIKLFGLTLLEIERDLPALATAAQIQPPVTHTKSLPEVQPKLARPAPDLHGPASVLPRARRGTIDLDASLKAFDITDPATLWHHKFKQGTVGHVLKVLLGSRGLKPMLPQLDPAKSASPQPAAAHEPLSTGVVGGPGEFEPLAGKAPERNGIASAAIRRQTLRRNERGEIDIEASLHALGIAKPKELWKCKIDPGSPEHELKKAIARALARRQAVPGITREEIGLSI